jgi:phospholipid/cholesterol/gamma-HCH transport system substrate-binding protein
MDERVVQFRVGVMVLATLIITVILVVMFGQGSSRALRALVPSTRPYTIFLRFPEAPGVNENTPIRKSGIVIGRVVRVDFADPELQRDVLVEAEIDRDRKVFTDEICVLNRTLVGEPRLEIVSRQRGNGAPRTAEGKQPPQPVAPQSEVPGAVIADPMQTVDEIKGDLRQTAASVRDASDEIRKFVKSINEAMGGDEAVPQRRAQFKDLIQDTRDTLRSIRSMADNANALLGGGPDGDSKVRETLRRIPELVDNLNKTMAGLDAAIGSMKETSDSARKNFDNLQRFTGPLGERGSEIAQGLGNVTRNFDALVTDMRTLTNRLNNQEGTLGKLIQDPSLYEQLNRASKNIEELTVRLRPIVEDVRVFTDKISRHPEELGIRGAIQQKAGVKW